MSATERERQGDGGEQAAAVAEAFRTHAGLVERVLRRAGVAERDLSDARQEVFIVVHRRLCEFEGRASLATWLYRIALHVASDHRRRAYQRREQLAGGESTAAALALAERPSADEADRDGGARDPVHGLEQRELLEHALRVLEQLDPDKRDAFVLAELYELPMREVAARLGCPQKTAFSRTYAARRRILAELHKHGSLPILPLFFPLRALRGLELQAGGLAPLAPFAPLGALVQLTGGSALVAAAVFLALLANRVPAAPIAAPRAPAAVVAAAPRSAPVPVPNPRVAPATAPAGVALARSSFVAEPVRVRRTAKAPPVLAAPPTAPVAPAPPAAEPVNADADDGLQVVRSGAVDLRPQLASPLAGPASVPAEAPGELLPGRIRLRGPGDGADAALRALDADPVFARPIALQ